ncbi:MAG TPA: outer-membrane lipoprotein carrier protein LolA [Hyphomicrobiaceae bacterium]|jgi:outer membrane lipoprotein-sorting protein|nr:outer-membrane lipoprotein carrier protein LolA [Hyphomicrobiaceae bacterium]
MGFRHWVPLASAVAFCLALAAVGASAQDAKRPLPPNAVGADGGWGSKISKEPAAPSQFTDAQLALIKQIDLYFNQLPDIQGAFVQTSADNKRTRGKFYMQRPGRFRFDYNPPSRLVITSDGQYLAIQDLDLKTDDRIALAQTPFRILLRKDVDLLRDAQILELQEVDDVIVISLQDKSPDNPGRIKLYLVKKPALELKEWVTTDTQGLETRVELVELAKAENLDPGLFKPAPVALQKLQ